MISRNHSRKLFFSSVIFFVLSISAAALTNRWFEIDFPVTVLNLGVGVLTWFLFELSFVWHTGADKPQMAMKIITAGWACVGIFAAAIAFFSNPGSMTHASTVANMQATTLSIVMVSIIGLAFSTGVSRYKKRHNLDSTSVDSWLEHG